MSPRSEMIVALVRRSVREAIVARGFDNYMLDDEQAELTDALVDRLTTLFEQVGWCDPRVPGAPLVRPLDPTGIIGSTQTSPWVPIYRLAVSSNGEQDS